MNHIDKLESEIEKWKTRFDQMAILYQMSQKEVGEQKHQIENLEKQLKQLNFKLN